MDVGGVVPGGADAGKQAVEQIGAGVGDLALVECTDAMTGEPRYVICAIARGADYVIRPFGHLAPGNPYEAYEPPRDLAGPRRVCAGPRVRARPGRV